MSVCILFPKFCLVLYRTYLDTEMCCILETSENKMTRKSVADVFNAEIISGLTGVFPFFYVVPVTVC